jgi:hypothetical protein
MCSCGVQGFSKDLSDMMLEHQHRNAYQAFTLPAPVVGKTLVILTLVLMAMAIQQVLALLTMITMSVTAIMTAFLLQIVTHQHNPICFTVIRQENV